MPIPTVVLNEATPAGGDKIREGDDRIREYKIQNREILEVDHKYESSGQDADMGKHKKVSLLEQGDLGVGATGKPILGAQTEGGKAELVYTDEDNNDVQLTSNGSVLGVPAGVIVMWSGAVSAIPSGWVICDGNNSTPDLTDRFVIHADADAAGTNDVGDTGGSKTISIANMPAHTHPGIFKLQVNAGSTGRADENDSTTQNSGSTGGGTDYMPKYYALAYIMKS